METLKTFLEFELLNIGKYSIRVYTLVAMVLIIIVTKLLLWFVKKTLFRKQSKLDKGSTYAIYQIIKYIIWVISFGFLLETIGIKVTVLIAGSAALLVGIGLGLQQTFNDIISGVILLSERSIKINDILEIDGDVVKIQEIGLRTSKGLNRDDISIIIPNSSITTSKVINWSHQSKQTRFRISVGVAYGSNVNLVMQCLMDSVLEHPEVNAKSAVDVRFADFGNSSLDFQVLFFSRNIFRIEKVKSDIRKLIYQKFTDNGIQIPFPQMDVHFKSDLRVEK